MPLGFGDRATVDLLLEISGRNDASSAVARAAADISALSAREKEFNAVTKAQNDLLKVNNDLRKAAHDMERLNQSYAAFARHDQSYNRFDNPNRYVNDLAKAENALRRIRQVEREMEGGGTKKVWQGLTNRDLDTIQRRMEKMGLSLSQYAEHMRTTEQGLGAFKTPKDINVVADKLSNLARAQEALGMHADELAVKLNHAEGAAHTAKWAEFNAVMDESAKASHDFERAWSDSERALQSSARIAKDTERALSDVGKTVKVAGKEVDKTSAFWGKLANRLDKSAAGFNRVGIGLFRVGYFIGAPIKGLALLTHAAELGDRTFSKFLGPLGFIAGPLSAIIGLATAAAGALLLLPTAIGAIVAALTVLADIAGTGLAFFVGLIPPVTMLVGLLGGLGAAFAYVTTQSIKNARTAQDHADALRTLHAAQATYNQDLKKQGANDPQTLRALVDLHKAQDAFSQSQLGVAINSAHIEDKFKSLVGTLSKDFTPEIISGTKALSGWLSYLDKVAHMPLNKAFASLAGAGVNRLQHNLEAIGGRIGPVIQDAIAVAFGSQNLRNKMVHDWNQIMNFLSGPHGALNPVEKWFNMQHFQRTGFRWAHELLSWINSSGLMGDVASLLGNAIKDGIIFGIKAGFAFLKTEPGLLTAGAIGGALIGGKLLGMGISALGAFAGGKLIAGAGSLAASVVGGGAASQLVIPGLEGGAAGAAFSPALAAALPILAIALEGFMSTTAPRLTGIQRLSQLTPLHPVGVTGESAFGQARFGHLRPAAISTFISQLSAHGGFNRFSRSDTVSGARDISAILGLDHRSAELNRSFSLLAQRPLAPNELFMIAHNMGLRQGIAAFARESGGRLPGSSVLGVLARHPRIQQLTGTLAAAMHGIPTRRDLNILAHVPTNAISAVEHLIRVVHGMPSRKQIRVTVKGVEEAQKHVEAMYKHLHQLSMERHQIQMRGGNTQQVDHQITGIQNKIKALSRNRTDVGKGLYLKPQYGLLTSHAQSIGRSIDQGVANGITANTGIFDGAVQAASNVIFQDFKKYIKSSSPSKRAAIEIGIPIVQGITAGMLKAVNSAQNTKGAKTVMQTMLQTMMGVFDNFKSQFQQGFGSLFTGPGGTGVNPRTGFSTPLATLLGFPGTKIPFGVVAGDLRSQLQTFKKFSRGLNQLQRKGYPLLLIQQIAALGPAAQPEIDALLSANLNQVHQYSRMFNEAQKIINKASVRQSIEQLDIWKSAGKGVAVGILAGLRSTEPQMEEIMARVISKVLKGETGHGRSGTRPHTVVHQTINASPSETLGTTLRRASFHYRHAST